MKTITATNKPAPSGTGALAIPEGVEEIDTFAYEDDRRINSVCFPDSLKRIGAHAFYNCRSIYKIRLGSSGTDIGDGAFKNCERLSEIEIVKNSESIRALKSVLYDAHRQVRVRIIYPEGESLIVFPYFMVIFTNLFWIFCRCFTVISYQCAQRGNFCELLTKQFPCCFLVEIRFPFNF